MPKCQDGDHCKMRIQTYIRFIYKYSLICMIEDDHAQGKEKEKKIIEERI